MIIFGVITIHEIAHIIIAKHYGIRVDNITITPMGLMAGMHMTPNLDNKKEMLINVAGPVINLIMICLGCFINSLFLGQSKNLSFFILVNASLLFINILPVLPLDGGKIFKGFLFSRFGYKKTHCIFIFFNKIFSIVIIILGIYQIYISHYNFSLILIGIFVCLYKSKNIDLQYNIISELIRKKSRMQNIEICDVNYAAVFEETRAIDAAQNFLGNKYNIIKVLDRQLKIIGELTESDIIEALINYGYGVKIGECLRKSKEI